MFAACVCDTDWLATNRSRMGQTCMMDSRSCALTASATIAIRSASWPRSYCPTDCATLALDAFGYGRTSHVSRGSHHHVLGIDHQRQTSRGPFQVRQGLHSRTQSGRIDWHPPVYLPWTGRPFDDAHRQAHHLTADGLLEIKTLAIRLHLAHGEKKGKAIIEKPQCYVEAT